MCLSVHPSHGSIVSKRLSVGSGKQRHTIAQDCSYVPLTVVCGRSFIPPEICAQSDLPPFEHNNFDQYLLMEPQPWELAKNAQFALIASWPRTFQGAVDELCTLPLIPQGWHKMRFCFFASKIQLLLKEVCCKVSLCENVRCRVLATSFFHLMVHRWIASDVPIYLKFVLKMTNPLRKRRFWQILLNSAAALRDSEKVQLSLIGSWQCALHWAIDEPYASHAGIVSKRLSSKWEFFKSSENYSSCGKFTFAKKLQLMRFGLFIYAFQILLESAKRTEPLKPKKISYSPQSLQNGVRWRCERTLHLSPLCCMLLRVNNIGE